jgi:outer membrane protein assembly factor BamD (BamD/ComL family)
VEAFRAAYQLRRVDAAAAVRRFRLLRARWPGSPLAHEVDLEIIEALIRIGRKAEVRNEASRFLKRYPKSPRAAGVRALFNVTDGKK